MRFLRKRQRALISVSLTLIAVSCRSAENPVTPDKQSKETVVSSTPPFQTKEPDRYRASRTITTTDAAGRTVVLKSAIARDGEMRRNESEVASITIAYLEVPDGRLVLLPSEKVYAELKADEKTSAIEDDQSLESSPEGLLHADVGSSSYEKVGTEVIAGRNTNKYRVVVNSSTGASVSVSETLIWVDETLKMPIRSETKSADGTRITMELSNISLDVDGGLFRIPPDFQKVLFTELHRRLKGK